MALLIHFTTEQGKYAPVPAPAIVTRVAGLPEAAEDGVSEDIDSGAGRFDGALEIVNCRAFDVPAELDTVTATGLGTLVSEGRSVAVILFGLTEAGVRDDPFQFSIESLVNPVPFTVSVKLLASPQKGAELGERDVSEGGVPGAALTLNKTTLDTSVVVVALIFCEGFCAVPGMRIAT